MKLTLLLLTVLVVSIATNTHSQVTVPCDVQVSFTDGSAPPPPPDINMSNGTISTCSATFFDPGGTGNYAASTPLTTQTFCSDVPGEEIILDFSAYPFQVETSFDFLNIYDGVGTGGTQLWNSQASGGAVNPGVITSTTGCLTITFSSDGSVQYTGFQADVSCTNPPPPGSGLDCNGGDVVLTAVGQGEYYLAQNNDFNGGTVGAGWVSTGGAAVGQPCGPNPSGTDYYWASTSTGTPNLTTVALDVTCGGFISFDMSYATQGGAVPCEGPDEPDEGVTFQYSTDGGATWTVIDYWDPLGGYDPTLTSWNTYTFPIPPAAMGPNTQFQWIQLNSSGTCCDNWGIDNVQISSVVNCTPYVYDWVQVPGNDDNPVQNETVPATTTYTVWYGNGYDSCSADITIIIPPGTTADAGLDQVICSGGPAVTIGADPVSLDDGAVYTWSTGATGTITLTGGSQDNGQITVSPAVTTDYFLEVTFNGCTAYDTVTVVVDDPPTASNLPNVNVECTADIPAVNINDVTTENDDITVNPTVTWQGDVSDNNTCPEVITRTYRVTDGCGNFVDVTQIITVHDVTDPVFSAAPGNITVECVGDVPAAGNLAYTDNCDANGNVLGVDVSDNGSCPEVITRTWTYTDACGNTATETQTITVIDTQAPVFAAAPGNVTVECIGDVPVAGNLAYTDNCDANGSVLGVDVSDNGSCPEVITRTWTYTDACGNTATETQTITVIDTQAPVFSAPPADAIVECVGDIPAAGNLAYTDNCDANGSVVGVDGALVGGPCGGTVTRTWTYTDACGNTATETQVFTVNDVTPPTASNLPAQAGTPPAANINDVFDEADNCDPNPVVTHVGDVSDMGNCPEIITRTYRITDACGNFTEVTQIFTVGDAIFPTASNPLPVNVQCASDVPAQNPAVVTDENDNGAAPIVTWLSDVSDNGSCPEIITRTYRVTDDCGNFIDVQQTITIHDTQAPVFAAAPADLTVDCIGDVPAAGLLGYTDNCDAAGSVMGTDVSDNGSCPEVITRTWTYTDACGNNATVSQTITVIDTQAPVFAAAPANITVECIGDVPVAGLLGYTDNCDAAGSVMGTDVSDNGSCPEIITRTWTYTDACGNNATVTQTITVHDTQAPVFAAAPANITVECIGDVPAAGLLGYTDNCDAAGSVMGTDVSDNGSCPEVITRTWTYTDACGNNATVSQTITVIDTQAPVFAVAPADITVQCVGDVPVAGMLSYTDNCDPTGSVLGTDGVLTPDACGGTILRTWTYTDACGNNATVTQTITVNDDINPTASNPVTTVVPGGPAPAIDINVVIDEADNCTVNPVVAFVSESTDGAACPETITRIYSVTDDCGNTINVTHIILITDPFLPTASNPAGVTVECIGDVPAQDPLVVIDEMDNQGLPTVAWVSDVSDNGSCPEIITRTYSVTDACGGEIFVTQTITVIDTQAPVFAAAPADITVECIGDVPAAGLLGYTDNCDAAGSVMGTDVSDNGSCPETITRTWTYTDACGNTSSVQQAITVIDTQAPVFAAAPANITVECIGDVPAAGLLGYTDNCDAAGSVMGTDVSDNGSCPEVITRTWTYTDACGNNSFVTQTITVIDTQAPVFASAPADISVQCIGDVPVAGMLGYTDNCDAPGSVLGTDGVLTPDACGGTIVRTWTYTDACGNTATTTQTITVNDDINPTASNPANTIVPGGPAPAVDINVVLDEADNCTANPIVAFVSESTDGADCPETITRIYSVTDDCGNSINVTHTILITDPIFPTADPLANVSYNCIGDVPAPNIADIQNEADNQGVPTVTWLSDVSDNGNCPEVIVRTYRVTDVCGNFIDVSQNITINVTAGPVVPANDGSTIECLANAVQPAAPVVVDQCGNNLVAVITENADPICEGDKIYTYAYTDCAGNVSVYTYTYTIDLTTAPLVPANAGSTIECLANAVQPAAPVVVDQCGNNLVPVITSNADPICEGDKIYTYTYTDCAGNVSVYTYTYTIDLTTLPVIPANDASNVVCISDVVTPTAPVVVDACGNNVVAVMTENADPVCVGDKIFTFTYTDCAGNVSVYTYTYSINDDVPPTASNPANISVPGAMDVPPADVTVVDDEADNCSSIITVVWEGDVSDGNVCNGEIITRTYSVTDECGNQILVTQEITILATYPPIDAGPDQLMCFGEEMPMTAINPTGVPISWDNGVNDGDMVSPGVTTIYEVTADNLGCISTDDMTLVIEDLPSVSFYADELSGCAPLTVTFSNTSTTSSSLVDCSWDVNGVPTLNGCDDVVYTFTDGGNYDITLTTISENGCEASLTYADYIYVEDVPVADFTPSTNELTILSTQIDFENNSINATDYTWSFGDDSQNSNQFNPSHIFPSEEAGSYVVELVATSPLGCADTAYAVITVEEQLIYYIPNTFTPDGDDYNQTFKPIFNSGYDPYDFTMLIFNRWGELIWESHDDSVGWDGTYGGRVVQGGVYTWAIEFKTSMSDERISINGHVNLMK